MSPEQAMGEDLDTRTDVFSFGVVLYRMATGARALSDTTAAAIFNAILNKAPVPPMRLNPELPADLERIINKALEKNRELRCQSAGEIRADLKRRKRATESGSSGVEITPGAVIAAEAPAKHLEVGKRGVFRIALVTLGILLGVALGIYADRGWLRRPSPPPVYRQLTFRRGSVRSARFAPDG